MIRFFRSLRFRLLAEGQLVAYLRYAFGEIVLVVLGILIALQINDWNEARKLRQVEIDTLVEIAAALQESRANLTGALEDDARWLSCGRRILAHLEAREPYADSLDICFGTYYWSSKVQFSTTAYQQLSIRGLDLIRSKSLMKDISRIHEYRFRLVAEENERWDWELLASAVYPVHTGLFRKYFPEGWTPLQDEYAKPVDYDALLDDGRFLNLLAELIALRQFAIATNRSVVGEIDTLVARIEAEVSVLRGD